MAGLRFCFLTTFYPPYSFGGDAVGVQRLARGLVRRGHAVTVVHDVDAYKVLRRAGEPEAASDDDGVDVVPLRSRLGPLSPLLTHQLGRPVANGRKIRRLLEDGRFDVVNFHNVSLVGGPGLLACGDALKLYMAHEHWLVCPMHVLWRHGREPCTGRQCVRCALHYRRPPQLYRWTGFLEAQLEHVDAFIAMSEFSRVKHREFGFVHDMEVVPYFLPDPVPRVAAERSPHARPYFLFVGRLEKLKGLHDVIPLFRGPGEADLLIAGEGAQSANLRRLAAGEPRVRFLGMIGGDELRACYQHAIALVVPSLCFETFGIVVIEAFENRTPVIARRIGPLPEIVEPVGAGELFGSLEELSSALRRLQHDPEYRDRLAAAGYRAYRERYCESVVLPRYLDVVRRTATRRGRHAIAAALTEASVRS